MSALREPEVERRHCCSGQGSSLCKASVVCKRNRQAAISTNLSSIPPTPGHLVSSVMDDLQRTVGWRKCGVVEAG